MFSCNVVSCCAQLVSFLSCLQDVKLSRIVIYRDEFRRMNCSLNWSLVSCGELHCDLVKRKTMINSSLFFLRQCEVFGLEWLFVCFVIVGYLFLEERSRTSNQGVFLSFTVFSGRQFLFSLPAPSPLPLTSPISSSLRRKFQHGASKLRAQRKRLHCRLECLHYNVHGKVTLCS